MSTLHIPLCKCPGSFVYEDLFHYMYQGFIMLPCPKCHGVPAVPGPSPSSFTSERHKISFIMNDIDISPLSPTATVRTGFTPDVTVPTARASIFQPSSAASLSSLAATSSSALASSSEAAPSRRGIKSSFVSRYPGTSCFDPYERPEVDPPPKKPRKVEQRKQRKPKSQKSEDGR